MSGKFTELIEETGEVRFPEHMMLLHRMWTYGQPGTVGNKSPEMPSEISNLYSSKSIAYKLAAELGASPYADVTAYPAGKTPYNLFTDGVSTYIDGSGDHLNFWEYIKYIDTPGWITASKTKAAEMIGVPSTGDNWFKTQGIWDIIADMDASGLVESMINTAYARFSSDDPRWGKLDAGDIDLTAFLIPDAPVIDSTPAVNAMGGLSAPSVTIDVDGAVDAYESRQLRSFQEQIGRIAAGMMDIRAMMNSQFGVALAVAETARRDQADEFEAGLRTEQARLNHQSQIRLMELEAAEDQQIAQMIIQASTRSAELEAQRDIENARLQLDGAKHNDQSEFAAGQAYQDRIQNQMRSAMDAESRLRELNHTRAMAKWQLASTMADTIYEKYKSTAAVGSMAHEAFMRAAIDRTKSYISAIADEQQMNLQLEVKDALWDLELYHYANSAISAVGGVSAFRESSRFERLINGFGAVASAATGLGSLVLGAFGTFA